MNDAPDAAHRVARAFEQLKVRYFLCGSMASSLRGLARSTIDVDFVADLRPEHLQPLVAMLGTDFDVDEEMVRDAIVLRRSFNVIHLTSLVKVDVFVSKRAPYDLEALAHATGTLLDGISLQVASAEDTILSKLVWYRLGNEVSDRQWSDILGVLRVQTKLDAVYLQKWAKVLSVDDLLARAQAQAAAE